MDRDQLRRIIAEELARALAEDGRAAASEPVAFASRTRQNLALVCFTGEREPCSSLPALFNAARRAGWVLEALPSFTFRSVVLAKNPQALGDLSVFGEPDDESAMTERFEEARAIIFPDLSSNSLNKAALGLADSTPTRALAHAMGSARGCVLLETREPASPVVGLARLENMRRLERRGATLARGEDFVEKLNEAASPLLPGAFRSNTGKPVGHSPSSRVVVTAEDVAAAAKRGLSRLALPPRSIITDRAREEARRLGIEFVVDEATS